MANRTTVILVADGTFYAHGIFNANEWADPSKPVVNSCVNQFDLLRFVERSLPRLADDLERACGRAETEMQRQYKRGNKWEVQALQYLVEIPDVHHGIHSFLTTTKTLLDLIVQLLATERIVHVSVHGFHKKGPVVGGEVLHALKQRRNPAVGAAAERIRQYLVEQKTEWIDAAVRVRDDLAHPRRGMMQVMCEMEFGVDESGSLVRTRVLPPQIGALDYDAYIRTTMTQVDQFSREFLGLVKTAKG